MPICGGRLIAALLPCAALAVALGPAGGATASAAPHAAAVQRVSTGPDGTQSATASQDGTVGASGRFVAYGTRGPADGCPADFSTCVFVKDLRTGAVTRVPGTGPETDTVMISADGRRVGCTTGVYHFFKAYAYDRKSDSLQMLWPADPPRDSWYERSDLTGLSADGDHAAYTIGNRNGDSGSRHLYVRDLVTGHDDLVDPAGHPGRITGGRLSADGRYVAYGTGTGTESALYVKDRGTGRQRRIDTAPDGSPADGMSRIVDISGDGRRVLFDSSATDLVPGGPAPAQDRAYLADVRTGRVQRVGGAGETAVSADPSGRWVLLRATDGALVLLDLRTGKRHTVAPAAASATALPGAVAAHGREVVFTSAATDLVPGDTNGVPDVFAWRRAPE